MVWALRAITRDFYPALIAPVGPVQNIFFLIIHNFTSFVPIAQQAGQEVVLHRLSLNMCLCPTSSSAFSFLLAEALWHALQLISRIYITATCFNRLKVTFCLFPVLVPRVITWRPSAAPMSPIPTALQFALLRCLYVRYSACCPQPHLCGPCTPPLCGPCPPPLCGPVSPSKLCRWSGYPLSW